MATITLNTSGGRGFDMKLQAEIALDTMGDAMSQVTTATTFQLSEDSHNYVRGTGTGLTYGFDSQHQVNAIHSGTFTSIVYVADGVPNITFTGASISGVALSNALTADSTTAFLNALLAGNDTIRGGTGADALYGGGGSDRIFGGAGNDRVYGESGADTLFGGAGNDTLYGGSGRDSFVFDTATNGTTNVDRIADFSVVDDTIVLDKSIFTQIGPLGELTAGAFHSSLSGLAHDSSDRIIYETDTGKLFYDSNGSAAGGNVLIATLGKNLALTYHDFMVIA